MLKQQRSIKLWPLSCRRAINNKTHIMSPREILILRSKEEDKGSIETTFRQEKLAGISNLYNFTEIYEEITTSRMQWTKDLVKKEVSKYKTLNKFRIGSFSAYNAAKRYGLGFFEEVTSQLKRIRAEKGTWTKGNCMNEALNYNTRNEFQIGSNGAYRASRESKWLDECCAHMDKIKASKKGYLRPSIFTI
jgi:hypothetical protein